MFLSLAMCLGVAAVAFTGYTVADAATDYYAGITATGGDELLGRADMVQVATAAARTPQPV